MPATSEGKEWFRLGTAESSPFPFGASNPPPPSGDSCLSRSAAAAETARDDETLLISGLNSAARSQYRRKRAVRLLSDRRIDLSDLKSRIVIEVFHVD